MYNYIDRQFLSNTVLCTHPKQRLIKFECLIVIDFGQAKDVGHIWELGGGTWLSKLMEVPLNPDTIQ